MRAFALGTVSFTLLQIQVYVKLFIIKRVAVGKLPLQVWVFPMGCISAGKGSTRVLARARGPKSRATPSPPRSRRVAQVEGCSSLGPTGVSSVLLRSADRSQPGGS